MTCPSCAAENPAGARFCINCGTRLAEACATCGAARVESAKFCADCGTPFGDVGAAHASAPQATGTGNAEAPVAERRLVSVLFADLVGFTPFADGRDAEEVRETLTRYFDLATEVIGLYGGTVEKFIGDAVMAVWGTPVAREDDAERSVRAALELVEVVRRLGPTIQARAGVLTGEAAVTLGATNQGMVAGDLVNVAARLQSVAEPGSVLVGESTMRAASAAIAFESIGEQALKGKSAPVPAWRAVRIIAERGGRGRNDTLEAPFVGRTDELHLLKELLHGTGREGRSRLVSLMGPAGIGKSRLAWEFLKYADGVTEDIWWHSGRSPAYGEGIAFWALGEMIRSRSGLAADDDEATTRDRIAATVREHVPDEAERTWIEPALLALLGIGAEGQGSEQLFAAWRTFFERMAATGTVTLVFEDLHWADPGTLDFIEHLLEWSRNSPIMIVTLARPELLDRRPDWGAAKRNYTSIYLEPLSEAEMRELLAGLVPGLPASAVDAIVARADGMPLYAVETVRTLIAEGRITRVDNGYVPTGDLSALTVPESLHALIAARLDALPAHERTLVGHAAVLGQSFTLAGLSAVAGDEPETIEPIAQELVRRELFILNRDPRSPEHGQYAFVQGLIREVAYAGIARRDRRTRHLAAARHFESIGTEEMAGALAVHYLAAHENASEGPEAEAIAGQARIALKAAADRAMALGAHAQVVGYVRQAMALVSDPAESAGLQTQAGLAASRMAHHDEAIGLLDGAVAHSREAGDRALVARSLAGLAAVLLEGRYFERSRAILMEAVSDFADVREPGAAPLHGQLARLHFLLNDYPATIRAAEPVLEAAEDLDLTDVLADTLITKGSSLSRTGRRFEGLALLTAGKDLAHRLGLATTELRGLVNLSLNVGSDDPAESFGLTEAALALTERMGIRDHIVASNLAESAVPLGLWQQASEVIDEDLASDPEGIDRLMVEASRWSLSAHVGNFDKLELDRLVREARAIDDAPDLESALGALLALLEGRLSDAVRLAIAEADVDPLNAPGMLALASHAAMWDRDRASLIRVEAAFTGAAPRGRFTEAHARAMRAGIEGLEGRSRESLADFLQSARLFKELAVPVDRALNAIDMAAVLGTAAATELKAEVDFARSTFEALGAKPYLERLAKHAEPSASPTTERVAAELPVASAAAEQV